MSACDFTLTHYAELVDSALRADYRFLGFEEVAAMASVSAAERVFLMRHDIDVCPLAALRMAELEHQLGISATYFFLVTSPYYNVASAPVCAALERIIELGGRVQLHFDALSCRPGQDMLATLHEQADFLQRITGQPIRVLSFHRPAQELLGRDLDGMITTYAPRFFQEMKYVSDSAMSWREGCVSAHVNGQALHCLIHPIWWAHETGDVVQRIQSFLSDDRQRRDRWLAEEIRSYRAACEITEPALMPALGG